MCQQHHVVTLAATGWPTLPGEIAALTNTKHAAQAMDGEFRFRPVDEREPHRCQSGLKFDPGSASNLDPPFGVGTGLSPIANRRAPRGAERPPRVRRSAAREVPVCPPGQTGVTSGAVFEAPGLVAGLDDLAVMREAIEQRGCHLGVAEHARPFAE